MVFLAGAVLSMMLACALLVVAFVVYHKHNWARILAWVVSLAAMPLVWATYIRNGASYINAIGTGPDDAVARAEMARVNELIPWRFSGWYHAITVSFGIAVVIFLLTSAVLLALPPSTVYFNRSPRQERRKRSAAG